MRKQVILCLKVAWVVAASMILLVGTQLCTSTEVACVTADNAMSFFMVLLTFPSGIIFFPIAMALIDSFGGHYPSDFIIGWSVLAFAGFVQWFYIMPLLLEKPGLTVLNLSSEPAIVPVPATTTVSTERTIESPMPATTAVPPAPIRIRARKQQNTIRSFDKSGRTPLERALHR